MITLYTFGPLDDLPDASPFVIKAQVLLKLAGLAFNEVRGSVFKAPKGKLPFITDDGETIADSTFIRFHIEAKYGFDFDAGLSPKAKAIAWAAEKMCEDHLYWTLVDARWCDDANFDKSAGRFFKGIAAPLRPLVVKAIRLKVAHSLKVQGTGRHGKADIARLAIRDIDALADIIGDGPFLTGERLCGADASVFGFVAGVLSPSCDSPIRAAAESYSNLVAYRDRIQGLYFPKNPA